MEEGQKWREEGDGGRKEGEGGGRRREEGRGGKGGAAGQVVYQARP